MGWVGERDLVSAGLLLGERSSHRRRRRRKAPQPSFLKKASLALCVLAMGALTAAFLLLAAAHKADGKAKEPPGEAACPDFDWDQLRLPTDVAPVHYTLHIHPNISTRHFTGRVSPLICAAFPFDLCPGLRAGLGGSRCRLP